MIAKPRIKVPERARVGDVVTIRSLISHPMESGLRADGSGGRVPRRIIRRLDVTFEGETVLSVDLEPGIAANPYFEFDILAVRSGVFRFTWTEDGGAVVTADASITVD